MKTIVTHLSLDLDAVAACWLIKRFLPNWQEAKIELVSAGSTFNNQLPDTNPNIIHVDTGLGKFDHHQKNIYNSATKLVFQYLTDKKLIEKKLEEPLERMVDYVNDVDHFAEVYFSEAYADRYDFCLHQIIESLKQIINYSDQLINIIFPILDAELNLFRNKIKAEKDIRNGYLFKSAWGKSIIMETNNEEALKLALKKGFCLAIRRDPKKGNLRIKTLPSKKLDLTPLYKKIIEVDKKATWFLHISKNMLLNSSSKNPHFVPSALSLKQLIEIIGKL